MPRQNNKSKKEDDKKKQRKRVIEKFSDMTTTMNMQLMLKMVLIVALLFLLSEQLHSFLFKREYELGVMSLGDETYLPSLPRCPQFFPEENLSLSSAPRFSLTRGHR